MGLVIKLLRIDTPERIEVDWSFEFNWLILCADMAIYFFFRQVFDPNANGSNPCGYRYSRYYCTEETYISCLWAKSLELLPLLLPIS